MRQSSLISWPGKPPACVAVIANSQIAPDSLTTLLYSATYAAIVVYATQPQSSAGGGNNTYSGGWFISVNVTSFVAWWICSFLTSLLFFFRVLAVFRHSRIKKTVFSVLWGLTGCATSPLLYTFTVPSMPASVCQIYIAGAQSVVNITSCPERPSLAMILLILIAAHSILVFVSVSYELLGNSTLANARSISTLFTGNGLHPVSKSLLRSGQLYVG